MARGGSANIVVILLLLSVLAGVCLMNRHELVTLYGLVAGDSTQHAALGRTGKGEGNRNGLLLGDAAQVRGEYTIPLNPMAELDFMTKKEVYDLRKRSVLQHNGLVREGYEPSEAVFGQIVDNRPWWGIYGIYGLGPGQRSIEGPSEESRFLLNPYLLIGLCEKNAFRTGVAPDDYPPVYPKPTSIAWYADRLLEIIVYDVHDHFSFVNGLYGREQYKLDLIAYNARDLRFNYLYVDTGKSDAVVWANSERKAVLIRQYIHCGGSCGYAGGCNNMSPLQSELGIELTSIPAKAYIKLWRDDPKSVDGPSDMDVIVYMM